MKFFDEDLHEWKEQHCDGCEVIYSEGIGTCENRHAQVIHVGVNCEDEPACPYL